MRGLFFFFILISSVTSGACLKPTVSELKVFFEETMSWTEVKNSESFELAERRPVFLYVPFDKPNEIKIRWGENFVAGDALSVCWAQPEKREIFIRQSFFQTKLIKIKPGLLKSWIPIDGDLYYRKDHLVQKPEKLRAPAKKEAGDK